MTLAEIKSAIDDLTHEIEEIDDQIFVLESRRAWLESERAYRQHAFLEQSKRGTS
jgi:hypothetical protein